MWLVVQKWWMEHCCWLLATVYKLFFSGQHRVRLAVSALRSLFSALLLLLF